MKSPITQALSITKDIGYDISYDYRLRIFKAHEFLCVSLAHQYARTAKSKGYVEANAELRKFHKMLTLGKNFQGLFIDSPDDDIKRFAEQKSLEILAIFTGSKKRYKAGYALQRVIKRIEDCDLAFPLCNPSEASPEDIASAIARCCDPDWWRRKIRNHQDLILEHVHIMLGRVNKKAGIYVSDHCAQRKLQQQHRNEQILQGLEAENSSGQVFNLFELAKMGVSNLTNRRNELMTRISGFEDYAKKHGDTAVFYTITAPSKYHSFNSKPCIPNPKYKGYSPTETQQYLTKIFSRMRAKLHRMGIQPYGFRVVEPHHDGTPHWHILFFMKPHEVESVTQVIRHYALEEDGHEAGAQKRRVEVELIDPNKGSAVGYIAKYIAKNIDGANVDYDLYGQDAVISAIRIRAWASNWNIRQFQQIGGPSVTVWREARRFANQDIAQEILDNIGDERLDGIIAAADTGNWEQFVELTGGPCVPRKEQPLRALHVQKETTNKYGEIAKKVLGFIYAESQKIISRLEIWTVRPVSTGKQSQYFNEGFSIGGANAPPLEFCQ